MTATPAQRQVALEAMHPLGMSVALKDLGIELETNTLVASIK